jgi:hypothetical protein
LILLSLVVALTGTVTLAAVAGARRTATSFERLQDVTRNHDLLVFASDVDATDVARLRREPGVDAVGYLRQFALLRPDGDFAAVGGPLDGSLTRDVSRPNIVAGRAPRPKAADEVLLGEPLSRTAGLGVGDALRMQSFTQAQVDQILQASPGAPLPEPGGPRVNLRIVGIVRQPIDLGLQSAQGGVLIVPLPFVQRYDDEIGDLSGADGAVLFVRLHDGSAGVDRFIGQLVDVLGHREFDVDPAAYTIGGVQESIDLLAIGVLAFGLIAAVAGAVALGLVLGRQAGSLARDQVATRDLGMTRGQRTAAVATPLLTAIVAGAMLAVAGAWAASPLFPFGVAGRAEPDPGLHLDAVAIGLGAVGVVVVLGGIIIVSAWAATRFEPRLAGSARPSLLTRALERAGVAPPATIGVRLALERGRGRTAVPVRSAIVGTVLAVAGVTAVSVFAASLGGVTAEPRTYGVDFDYLAVDTRATFARDDRACSAVQTDLVGDRDIEALGTACSFGVTVDGRAVGAIGFSSLRGAIGPTVLEGRTPGAPDEVALGTETLDALHVDIGDTVTAEASGGRARYRVVGRVVIPQLREPQAVADGAVFSRVGLDALDATGDEAGDTILLLRLWPGTDARATGARIERIPGVSDGAAGPGLARPRLPLEVVRLRQVDRIPLALGLFLGLLGVVAVGLLLFTSVQRRRHDFGVLKSLGFARRQLYATVVAAATTVAGIGVIVGLVVGVAAGSMVWRAAAANVGILELVEVPALVLLVIAIATFAVALGVAILPARSAARTRAAVVLRDE